MPSMINMIPSNMPHMMNMMSQNGSPSLNASANMTAFTSYALTMSNSVSPQVWLTDSGATNHMTNDLNNLPLASPYPHNETVQTVNGEGLQVSHIGNSLLRPSFQPIKLNYALCIPKLSHNLM